jgi:hypothetical protein
MTYSHAFAPRAENLGVDRHFLALMAPSMAANINPQGIVGSVGRAIPLAFILATLGGYRRLPRCIARFGRDK